MTAAPVPVTLLTGFLGSGKTTTLNRLLRTPAAAGTAVIVNEFGEIGLDQVLIERAAGETVLLGNGCVCCTMQDDLGATLGRLVLQRAQGEIPRFARVVIETTGLADPAPIIHLLMTDPLLGAHYKLGGVITTADAVNGSATLDRHMEAVRQIAVADRILVTKTDVAEPACSDALAARLVALNPAASLVIADDGELDAAGILDAGLYNPRTKSLDVQRWLNAEAYARRDAGHTHGCDVHCTDPSHEHARHEHGIDSFAVVLDKPMPWAVFSSWLDALALKRGADLLRIKGIVNIAERPDTPIVLHGVQQIFHPPLALPAWPSDDRRTRLVFITRNIGRSAIEETLRLFTDNQGKPS
jgi:G3E family GTPase